MVVATEASAVFSFPLAGTLPLGLPWIDANFRLDALSAFFLV